jgi:ornithine cyclodeaminase
MLLMPAWQQQGYLGMKMVHVFPQNAAVGLPAISGLYILSEGEHGQPVACFDGAELTRRRTAAASAVASQLLARPESQTLLLVGTGQLAPMLLEAHASVLPIRRVLIWGRKPERVQALIDSYTHRFDCAAVTDLPTAIAQADVISCATLSTQPIIEGAQLPAGVHLDLVGAFKASMRESDAAAIAMSRVYVDTWAGAQGEAGDLLQAEAEGQFQWSEAVADIRTLLQQPELGRQNPQERTLFKSVGASFEDLATAIALWQQLGTDLGG